MVVPHFPYKALLRTVNKKVQNPSKNTILQNAVKPFPDKIFTQDFLVTPLAWREQLISRVFDALGYRRIHSKVPKVIQSIEISENTI